MCYSSSASKNMTMLHRRLDVFSRCVVTRTYSSPIWKMCMPGKTDPQSTKDDDIDIHVKMRYLQPVTSLHTEG